MLFIILGIVIMLASLWGGSYILHILPYYFCVAIFFTSSALFLNGLLMLLAGVHEYYTKEG